MVPRLLAPGSWRSRTLALLFSSLPALALALVASPALAVGQADAPNVAQKSISDADRESDSVKQAIANAKATERSADQRIADADILIKSRDFGRAIVALNEVIEKYPGDNAAYPDALSMLGEAYYQSRQLLSARREFKEIVQKAGESRMASYVSRAYERLVDIALKTQDSAELDALLLQMGQASGDATLSYAKAKGMLSRRDLSGAKGNALGVPATHPLYHQAKYLLGVIAMREAIAAAPPVKVAPGDEVPAAPPTRFAAAIEAFRQVTQLPPDTAEHRKVIDLSWLAIGRLFYEADQWLEAADAYNHVDRQSGEFGTSLYELAWVYVRLGDTDRAARALEILAVADPNNAYLADGTLLRADLMLRSGQFDKSLTIYESVRGEYDPMRARVDSFLGSTTDPAVYYDKLASEQLDTIDNTTQLPSLAVQWAREERDGPAAFAVLDDVQQCRDLIRQSQQLVGKLHVILTAPNRIRAFPELRAGDEKALQLLNRISQARATIGQGLDDAEPSEVSGELAQVRSERRELQKRILIMPVTDSDLNDREASAQRQWNTVSQHLQQLQLEVDQLQAIVNGLKRMIADGSTGTSRDPATVAQWRSELDASEKELTGYKDAIANTRKQIEFGRVQVGYGDQRFIDDEGVRVAYRAKLAQEISLVAGGAGGASAQAYAGRANPVLSAAIPAEDKLLGLRKDIDAEVAKKVGDVIATVDSEAGKIAGYQAKLNVYDQEARMVVGQVAMRNFGLVRDKLRGIVLRADVGAVEQAWEVREEEMARVRNLNVERVREEQVLQEELREVLDDSVDPTPATTGSPTP